jgi:hypothetical protein
MATVVKSFTLSRALRWKNRLAEKIRGVEETIRSYNSMLDVNETVDTQALLLERESLVGLMIALKLQLQKSTMPIMEKILKLAEVKAEIAFLGGIPTTEGKQESYHSDSMIVYKACIKREEVKSKIEKLKDQIDILQTEIDDYNASTKVEVEIA